MGCLLDCLCSVACICCVECCKKCCEETTSPEPPPVAIATAGTDSSLQPYLQLPESQPPRQLGCAEAEVRADNARLHAHHGSSSQDPPAVHYSYAPPAPSPSPYAPGAAGGPIHYAPYASGGAQPVAHVYPARADIPEPVAMRYHPYVYPAPSATGHVAACQSDLCALCKQPLWAAIHGTQ